MLLYSNFIGMPTIKFTSALKKFFSGLKDTSSGGDSLSEVLNEIETSFPGIRSYIVDDQGSLRKHVNIFIDGRLITDRTSLSDSFSKDSEIYIIQALSGG
jgi:molybdopterin synthase sulfur carrier subunit